MKQTRPPISGKRPSIYFFQGGQGGAHLPPGVEPEQHAAPLEGLKDAPSRYPRDPEGFGRFRRRQVFRHWPPLPL